MKIQIYDTTLRDGTQGESVSFSVQDKLNELIAKMGENISIKNIARFQIGQ